MYTVCFLVEHKVKIFVYLNYCRLVSTLLNYFMYMT